MSARNITLACMLLVIIIGGIGSYIWYRHHVEELFFSHALASAGVTVPGNASLGSLELLYAQTMAIRSPLFGIVGTDPADLADAVSALATTTQELASAQLTSQDAQIVQNDLYPIDFLRSLATTEADREAFVENGTAQNEQAYDDALHATASAGIADSEAFDSGLEIEVGTSTFTLATTAYPITSALMLQSASDTVAKMEALDAELDARDACVSGTTASCNADDIATPQVTSATLPPSSAPLSQLSSDVISTFSLALPSGILSNAEIVRLGSSICLDALPGPYYLTRNTTATDPRGRYLYIGDIMFTKSPPWIQAIPYASVYDITYVYDDPLQFYQCPETEFDMSEVSAVENTAEFAQTHPGLAPEDAFGLEGQVADEGYARKYIADAFSQAAASSTEESDLVSLALEFNEGDADLSTLVDEVAVLEQFNLKEQAQGMVENETDIDTLFYTHSAFPSLFLTSTPSSTPIVVPIREQSPTALSQYPYISELYSALRDQVPESKIVHDLKADLNFQTSLPQQ